MQNIQKKEVKYFGFIFWMHLILVLFAYLSPFLFSWKIVGIAIVFLFIQYSLIGGCVLNKIQFDNTRDITFLYPYLRKFGFKINPYKFKIFIRYILPFILLFIAIIWQIALKRNPLIL